MPVPTTRDDLNVTESLNSPAGSEAVGTSLDNYIRAHAAIIKQYVTDIADGTSATKGSSLAGFLPYGSGKTATTVQSQLRGNNTEAPDVRGFFDDEGAGANIHRFRDRVFVGDATRYTGNRLGASGYGTSWITTNAASWIAKNSFSVFSTEDGNAGIGVLGASRTAPGVTPTYTNCGVAAFTLNEGTNTYGRALYAEAMHREDGTGSSGGIEVQVGNYTARVPVANAYSMGSSVVNGVYIGAESGVGYTVGDADSAISPALNPAGAAIDIAGGSIGASYQKWTTGIVFRNGALLRDGSDFAKAISLAQKHRVDFEIGASDLGASIWSEVTTNTQTVGIKFTNRKVQLLGHTSRILVDTLDDTAGAGAVNYPILKNSRTNSPVALGAEGSDTNVILDLYSKGTSSIRLLSHGGVGENLRIVPPASAPTDYLTIAGSASLGNANIGAAGASTNIDILLSPKGSGVLRFGTWTSNADAPINGYVTIKDSGGTTRKLATIA